MSEPTRNRKALELQDHKKEIMKNNHDCREADSQTKEAAPLSEKRPLVSNIAEQIDNDIAGEIRQARKITVAEHETFRADLRLSMAGVDTAELAMRIADEIGRALR